MTYIDQMFTVKIQKTGDVSILKKIIEEDSEKVHHLNHLDASDLKLFRVSLLVDHDFKERFENTHPESLVQPFASLSQLFPHVESDHLHIIIQAFAAHDTTPLLSLNCFVLGDDQDRMFTVKIPKTKNVNILRDIIKERKHRLHHIDASDLKL